MSIEAESALYLSEAETEELFYDGREDQSEPYRKETPYFGQPNNNNRFARGDYVSGQRNTKEKSMREIDKVLDFN